MKIRWKVACINWSHDDVPRAFAYAMVGDRMCSERYFSTWAEALSWANGMAGREPRP